jgi:hypothetical protein
MFLCYGNDIIGLKYLKGLKIILWNLRKSFWRAFGFSYFHIVAENSFNWPIKKVMSNEKKLKLCKESKILRKNEKESEKV